MSCCKEKAVLVAVYEEKSKPRKRRSISIRRNNNNANIKQHHHYHHHHHHLHVHQPVIKDTSSEGGNINRRARLLSYSKHLRDSSKTASTYKSPADQHHDLKQSNSNLVLVAANSSNSSKAATTPPPPPPPVVHVQTKHQKLKNKQSSSYNWVDNMNKLFKCFAVSRAKRKVKTKTKKKNASDQSSAKKASVIMKSFNARTQKGARGFFKKLMATIQKYR